MQEASAMQAIGMGRKLVVWPLLACVLMDHALRHRAQCGDVRTVTPKIGQPRG